MESTNWINFVVGVAATVGIIGALFRFANGWMVTQIGIEVQTRINTLLAAMNKDFAKATELEHLERYNREAHDRFDDHVIRIDKEFGKVWTEMNKRRRINE